MGLIHTGICSKLGVNKVHKSTMVGMDIIHLEAGLLYTRGKWNFTSEAGAQEPNHLDIGDQDNDLLNFDQLYEHLIMGAASANPDKDVQAPSSCHCAGSKWTLDPFLNLAMLSSQATQVKRTCTPLKILFNYPTNIDMPLEGMNSVWRGGIENLEKEMEAYNILHKLTEENSDGIHP